MYQSLITTATRTDNKPRKQKAVDDPLHLQGLGLHPVILRAVPVTEVPDASEQRLEGEDGAVDNQVDGDHGLDHTVVKVHGSCNQGQHIVRPML